ncbi:hypothetical protein I4U23_015819 [Adineta vaga]|nr:hypothetical protein I4U23_015819 [Adineta vaga]
MDRIALIGISCEFSNDIHSPHALWSFMATNAHHGSEVETEQTDSSLESVPLLSTGLNSSEESTQHRYFLKKELLDEFDRDFFGISDQEAQIIDPSDRILLEKFVHLLEDSNYTINQINGTKTAVFIEQTSDKRPLIIAEKGFDSDTAPLVSNLHNCSASIRLAYHFNLRGPNLTLDTTHPSSLVSLSMAVQALRTGEADYAVIGGTNVLQTNEQLLCDKQLQPVPSEGRNGYTKGEGVALILLKRLSDAIRDCDQIYCVIRDVVFHCDNDIVMKDFPMASHSAQLQLLTEIYITRNQIDLSEIFYIEELDGGTIHNELIKNNAIGEFFHHNETSVPLLLGTIKSNIGDIGSAAGTAALINVALSMKNRIILPQRNYGHDNMITKSEKYNVQIAHQRTMFPQNRLALIGINGKNSHAIIEEWGSFSQSHSEKEISSKCLEANNSSTLEQQQYYLAVISAKCQLSLISQLNNFSKWYSSLLLENQNHILPGLCYKLLLKRNTNFSHRASFIFSNNEEFKNQISVSLSHVDTNNINGTPGSVFCQIKQSHASQVHQNICFVYCGTGPQWWKMGRELYNSEPVFRKWIDKISKELQKLTTEWSLIEELINVQNEKSSHINETNIAQPAIFAVQVALTALWLSWGIYPRVILGHSVGEIAAAYVGGRLTLEDACIVIYHYSRLQHRNTRQGGRMLAVMGLNETEARSFLKGIEHRVSFAAINSPTSVTYSGFSTELEQLHQLLTKTKPSVFKTWIRLENALHSPLMDNFNIYQDLLTSLSSINGDYYKIHEDDRFDKVCANATLYSTVTGECKNLCFDCSYWWKNLRNTAMFSQTIQTILHERLYTTHVFLEISPHPVLVSSIQECMDYLKCDSVPLIIHSLKRKENEQQTILSSLCRLPNINWSKFLRTRSWNASSNDQTILCRLNQMPYYAFDNRKVYDYRTTTIISLRNDIKSNDQLMLSIDIEKITKDVHSMVEKLFTLSNILGVIDTDRSLMAQGLDSLTAMSLAQSLCLKYSTRIPVTTLLQEDANESQESNTTKASSDYSSKYDGFNDISEFKNYQLVWKPLNLIEARASYAQERIWFDTKVRFNGQTAIYNELLLLKVSKSGISLNRLQRAVSKVKLAVVLDEQSLTYSELMYYVQHIASYLIHERYIKPKDVISAGAVYCPLNPNDPWERISLLTNEVQPKLIIYHSLTSLKFQHKNDFFVSVGQVGELYIGSFGGMFQGYLNRPNLTEEVMKELPGIVDEQKFYRSGDLVKINKWGTIEFVGRKDFQVKLSGQRIETGEIENTIMKLSSSGSPYSPCIAAIHNCLVMKVSHESKEQDFLVAYIHTIHDDLEKRKKEIEKQIKTHCQKHLPVYMIPSFFILMKEFPLNQNGKVDRKQLPTLTRSLLINETLGFDDKHSDVVINTAIEQVLLKIFIESFDISADMANKINVDISFSALGASSLHAMKALTLIRKRLYPDMNIQLLFSNPSVRQLARVLETLVAVDTKFEKAKTKYHHYLCAKIGENVEIGITIPDGFLGLPGSRNLVQIDSGATVNCDYLLLPMEITHEQECRINKIQISDNVFIGNMVTIHQGATIKAQTTVGSLTRITSLENTVNNAYNPHQFYLDPQLTVIDNNVRIHCTASIQLWVFYRLAFINIFLRLCPGMSVGATVVAADCGCAESGKFEYLKLQVFQFRI